MQVSWEKHDSERGGSPETEPEGSDTGSYLLIALPEAKALGPSKRCWVVQRCVSQGPSLMPLTPTFSYISEEQPALDT